MTGPDVDEPLFARSRALGDPTRFAVFEVVRDARRPVTVAELTDHFGLNHNAIRQHLAKLVDAGLVVGEPLRTTGSGRPPVGYRPVPGAGEQFDGTDAHERLALLLVELLTGDETPVAVGRRAGAALAAEHAGDGDALLVLEAVARRLGFEPRVEATDDDGVDVVLDRCPFVGTATTAPEVVCGLHQGIAEGIADAAEGGYEVTGLVVRPPDRAGCRIHVAARPDR